MMGQELFENPSQQYKKYDLTPLPDLTQVVSTPEALDSEEVAEQQIAAVEEVLEQHPGQALAFDDLGQTWIIGQESDVEEMFSAREKFIEALEAGEDPGI